MIRAPALHRPANRLWVWVSATLLAVVLVAAALPALAAPTFPRLSGRVVDGANLLTPAIEQDLTARLEALETATGRQLVVVTLPDLQGLEIEDYGYRLGRAWGIGDEKTDSGALFIIAPKDRKVRIEVGYGLEGILTDALSSVILQSAVLPKFRDGDMPGGVVAGTEALIAQLSLPDDAARATAQKAAASPPATDDFPIPLAPVLFFLFIVLLVALSGRRRRSGILGWLPWILANSGGWSGGSGGGWSSGGGGFSGGGGSFGGGGSSGSW